MQAAKRYDEIGWVVLPIKKNEKRPTISEWSSIKDNSQTLNLFKDDSNLGVLMGKPSGVICIDVDVKKADGLATLTALEDRYGALPETVYSTTPSGGKHYYFKYHDTIINRKKVGAGIDIQADGTQTLEYPSMINGEPYEWIVDPFNNEVAELPDKWLDYLSRGTIELVDTFVAPEEVQEGSRNNTMAAYVGSMLGKKLKKETVLRKALKYNKEHFDPPLDDDEVETIVNSMIKTDIKNKKEAVTQQIEKSKKEDTPDVHPEWLTFDETGAPCVDEKKFSEWYVERNQIHCVNGRFFGKYGLINDGLFEHDIHNIIGSIVKVKLASKVKDLLAAVKNEAYMNAEAPDAYKIQFDNVAFDVSSGELVECDRFFTLHQIPHEYDELADCPTWIKFINDLFEKEDIPIIQEFLGYCLIPNTLAQTSLFITGEGGEGKSRITIMMEHILGANSVVIGNFKGLQEKFAMVSLDNQMLFIDDDLSLDALDDTSNFKKIVTAETMLEVEPKGKPKYKTKLYAKILCCGNGAVTSKFDRSDGFYRRLLISKVKPVPANRVPDRRLSEKLKEETPGIINWLLEGLLRVVNNGFVIEGSNDMKKQVKELRDTSDTMYLFLDDDQYVTKTYDREDKVSVRELYQAYETWCNDNGYLCIHKTTFGKTIRKVYKDYMRKNNADSETVDKLTMVERVYVNDKQVRGMVGIKLVSKSYTK